MVVLPAGLAVALATYLARSAVTASWQSCSVSSGPVSSAVGHRSAAVEDQSQETVRDTVAAAAYRTADAGRQVRSVVVVAYREAAVASRVAAFGMVDCLVEVGTGSGQLEIQSSLPVSSPCPMQVALACISVLSSDAEAHTDVP